MIVRLFIRDKDNLFIIKYFVTVVDVGIIRGLVDLSYDGLSPRKRLPPKVTLIN